MGSYEAGKLNWGRLTLSQVSNTKQAERQGKFMWCKVADDSVVVNNSEPMKNGNIMEEKTQRILCIMS